MPPDLAGLLPETPGAAPRADLFHGKENRGRAGVAGCFPAS